MTHTALDRINTLVSENRSLKAENEHLRKRLEDSEIARAILAERVAAKTQEMASLRGNIETALSR